MEKNVTDNRKGRVETAVQPATAVAATTPPAGMEKPKPLFRPIDWLALAVTTAIIWVVYFMTMAPELTLEDSGELCTGSFYAGIPHPPGYPVWTIYSWLWTVLVPVGNVAWRVALGQVTSGALACGLLALMVSRGSSMLMEGIEELKAMTGKWESIICAMAGLIAGLLLGLDSFMWRESIVVNRIAVFSVPWLLTVLLCIMRWMYAPHQMRYAYVALFLYGMTITTHQSLLVTSIGIEVALALRNPKLGRDIFFGNFVIYLILLVHASLTRHYAFHNIEANSVINGTFHIVGIASLIASTALAIKTEKLLTEWKPVIIMGCLFILGVSCFLYMPISGMTNPPMQWGYPRTVEGFFHALTRGQYEQPNPINIFDDPGRFIGQLGMLVGGLSDEYTWVAVLIALLPLVFLIKMQKRERAWILGLTTVYFCSGVLLMILINPTPDRASSDLVKVFFISSHSIFAGLIGYGIALVCAYMATHYALFRRWGLIGGGVAALLAVICLKDTIGTHYFGPAGKIGLDQIPALVAKAFEKNQYGLPIYACLFLLACTFAFILAHFLYRNRAPLTISMALFAGLPVFSGMSHWFDSDQRNHMFGYWFGHDMFTPPFKGKDGKPIYPEMTKDAILFGGTDPGRFCPTYMIFCESFIPHDCQPEEDQKFDRRDVYIITQNALADGTYLCYIRAHYNKSDQIQYDTPFFQYLVRPASERTPEGRANLLSKMVAPLDTFFTNLGDKVEKDRRTYTSWLKPDQFTNFTAFVSKLRTPATPLCKWIAAGLSPETRALLGGNASESQLRSALAGDLNILMDRELVTAGQIKDLTAKKNAIEERLNIQPSSSLEEQKTALDKQIADLGALIPEQSLYSPERFKDVPLSEYVRKFIAQNPRSHTRVRLNRLLLEEAFPGEIQKSLGGVYPDREIYIPTPADWQECFNVYIADAQKRLQHDMQFPNEPKQIRAGEDVHVVQDPGGGQRVQVAGQVAVMAINGLLTKVIFDHNPDNEFFVEESFPLDWMYPYLTPYGVIMKINRNPLPELTDEICQRDHEFWKQYSKRLCGDFIDYDTPVKTIAEWAEKTYLQRDFNGYIGDIKFALDNDGQKAFSKLRSSIGGIYSWRVGNARTPVEQQRMIREADFALKQAFAFCPYSPEAVYRYVQLLANTGRFEDALIVADTCLKLDPFNGSITGLRDNLKQNVDYLKAHPPGATGAVSIPSTLDAMESRFKSNPEDLQNAFALAGTLLRNQRTNDAWAVFDSLAASPKADAGTLMAVAKFYADGNHLAKLESVLEKLTQVAGDIPESWYDYAALKSVLNKPDQAFTALRKAVEMSDRQPQGSNARNLRADAATDGRFAALRALPEFKRIVATN